MPDLDYAVLCDYVRMEGGLGHIIAAGIDIIIATKVPTGHNFGVALQLEFTRNECGRPHRVELHLQDTDGEALADIRGSLTPQWNDRQPPGWKSRAALGLNFGVVFPRYGVYSLELLVDDVSKKSLRLRVEPPADR